MELSPHPVLTPAIAETLAGVDGRAGSAVITTLHRDRPDLDAVATALAQLHTTVIARRGGVCTPTPVPSRCPPTPSSTGPIGWRPPWPASGRGRVGTR